MTLPMLATALDTAAVGAMVSVVGSYTLQAIVDSEQRAQHKQQCAERLRLGDGRQVQYAEQAILANLDWGIDALEEAIGTNNKETMTARLDHAEKMLQVCALLDCRATTGGVPNSYLSAWAHFNLAFVWKLRGNDRKAANHMLEMFLVDPFYSRVDFAPALWEYLFLPHLPNIVTWYTKQRKSIVVSGSARKMNEDYDTSQSFSTDFTAGKDVQVNVLSLSAHQTSQLQGLEKLYQDSLDENTRQYARYYKDWLNYDSANKRGMPLMPIAEPPMTPVHDAWVPPTYDMPLSFKGQAPPGIPAGSQLLGQKRSSSSLSKSSSLETISEFKEFHNPEFVESGRPANTRDGLQDDPDSPNSNFRKRDWHLQVSGNVNPALESSELMTVANPESGTPSSISRSMVVSNSAVKCANDPPSSQMQLEATSPEDSLHVATWNRRGVLDMTLPGAPLVLSDEFDYPPLAQARSDSPKKLEWKHVLQPTNSANSKTSFDSSAGITSRGGASTSTSSSPSNSDSNLSKEQLNKAKVVGRSKSGRYYELGMSIRNGARRLSEVFNKSGTGSPAGAVGDNSLASLLPSTVISDGDSSNNSSDSEAQNALVQDPASAVQAKTPRKNLSSGPLPFVPRYNNDEAASSEGSLVLSRSGPIARDDATAASSLGRCIPKRPVDDSPTPHEHSGSHRELGEDQQHIGMVRHRRRSSGSLGWISYALGSSTMATHFTRPPKDFVCPITSQLFNDPVTLETGQTYERKAIQEWLYRGNTTCPISRQALRNIGLPKTNYVFKRMVDSWKEEHPELAAEFGSSPLLNDDPAFSPTGLKGLRGSLSDDLEKSFETYSPSSVSSMESSSGPGRLSSRFSRRTLAYNVSDRLSPSSPIDLNEVIADLRPALTRLCNSEDLAECESVILDIARLFNEAKGDQKIVAILSKADIVNGMIEVLFNSSAVEVLRATLFLLSGLISRDEVTRQTVISADPEVECLMRLLREGLTQSVVLLYQLKLPISQLTELDLLPLLVMVIKQSEENRPGGTAGEQDLQSLSMKPRSAAIMLLEQIVTGGDQSTLLSSARALLALQAVPALISSLETKSINDRTSVVTLLLCCMQSDGRSRNMISEMSNLAPVVELLHSGNNKGRTVSISFLADLVRLNRRSICEYILQTVKTEGLLSTMHVLLVHLQMAPLEHRPVAASLLLQLDLLDEPRKCSMYREEAVESLLEALTSTEWPSPIEAANTLLSLGGRFSNSGKPMMEAWLLKTAGLEKSFLALIKNEQDSREQSLVTQEDEEKAAKAWERRVAGALIGYEWGALIEALGQAIQSRNPEVSRPSMIVATWLTHLLPVLPDTGIRQTTRNCLLDHFVGVLQTSKDLHQRVLSALAIHTFLSDPEGVQELLSYVKDIAGPLRQLKKTTWVAREILRAFTNNVDANASDVGVYSEQGQLDTSANGEVRALVRAKKSIFSGHSDGTIKVWDAKKRFPVLVQELREHVKSVMALTVSLNSDRLYSGSLDKSIRVWALGPEDINCVHVFDLKDPVMGLVVTGPMACIIPQGLGIKVQYEDSATKVLNANKHVRSLAISDGKIFCGCTDNSIQELDSVSGSIESIQHGVRMLLGKKSIYAIQVFQDYLYAAGSPVDGASAKVWKLSDHSLVGTLSTTTEVRSMAVSEDFVYLGSSTGVIEVWLRERLLKVSTLNAGSKVISLMLHGDTLYSGSEDGKIRVWTLI